MIRTALVTGITGFIGGELAKRLLAKGWRIVAIVRPGSAIDHLAFREAVTFHTVEDDEDLRPVLSAARADIVFHLASLYLADHRPEQVEALVRSNILFPTRLAQAMVDSGTHRLINTGTAWQKFGGKGYLPVNLYAATKQAAEDILLYYADAHRISVTNLLLFDTYGQSDQRRKLIQVLIDAARSGKTLAMSPGDQIVDLTHVDDIVDGFLVAAERQFKETRTGMESYFLAGERHSVKDLTTIVGDALGRSISLNFGGRPYRSREVMVPAATDGRVLPGWQPRHRVADYVAMTML